SDALTAASAAGDTRLITITTSAYSSYSSCRQYREDLAAAVTETGLSLQLDKVRQYFDHPGFVQPFIEGVREALAGPALRGFAASEIHVLFSTHSIPAVDADRSGPAERQFGPGGAYVAQHLAVASAVMDAVALPVATPLSSLPVVEPVETRHGIAPAWSLVYQSRSGPPSMPWLEPDINAAIEKLAAAGTKAVVIVPLGFVSDHMEVKWDLDTEAAETARVHGVVAVRVPTPGAHPAFVAGLIDLVLERVNGTPVAERPALTDIGPWYDVCRPGCCENVRLGFKPALAGEAP
ncbi:MAG TPA: ferrochelatase, partial [Thermopolyspora sp.]